MYNNNDTNSNNISYVDLVLFLLTVAILILGVSVFVMFQHIENLELQIKLLVELNKKSLEHPEIIPTENFTASEIAVDIFKTGLSMCLVIYLACLWSKMF